MLIPTYQETIDLITVFNFMIKKIMNSFPKELTISNCTILQYDCYLYIETYEDNNIYGT